ncbi:hypothetical protein ACQY0O_007941 [Thecaphora frezii]
MLAPWRILSKASLRTASASQSSSNPLSAAASASTGHRTYTSASPTNRARILPEVPNTSKARRTMSSSSAATSNATSNATSDRASHGSASHAQAQPGKPLNRLANAKSPYLLQHKEDPVDWYEFTDAAFEKAHREDKLVFLSIGYSSCHWCHQMRYDSFSKQEVADVLNRDFVSVKVDREERPDVDATYMQFILALNGSGGWPLTAFLTPDAKPLFGGTFFPRQQFLSILRKLSEMWYEDRQNCLISASSIEQQLNLRLGPRSGSRLAELPGNQIGVKATEHWMKRFDSEHGGFGDAPKFPTVSNTHHLLHRFVALSKDGQATDDWKTPEVQRLANEALRASLFTLLRISRGGITDHLGGGIARYSVDNEWRVPHFEKMLYDQGQLLTVYCEAILLARRSGDAELEAMLPELEAAARGIVTYLGTSLSHDEGGLYSAEDADSLPTPGSTLKKEGVFYVWRQSEIEELLGKDSDEAKVVVVHYDIKPCGNIPEESDPHGELTNQNMLHAVVSVRETAAKLGLDAATAEAALASAKRKMLERRDAERPRPHLDDKVIAAWNGLAISGLCKAAEVLPSGPGGSGEARRMALAATGFLVDKLYSAEQNRLRRSWRDGAVGPWGFASDYAFVAQAMLDVFELDGDPERLELAVKLQTRLDEGFWDEAVGGYFITEDVAGMAHRSGDGGEGGGSSLLTRQKDEQDGAEPSAASVAAHNLMRLCWLFDVEPEAFRTSMAWAERRDAVIRAGGMVLERASFALGTLTTALLGVRNGGKQIVITGPGLSPAGRASGDVANDAETGESEVAEDDEEEKRRDGQRQKAAAMLREVRSHFLPYRSLVLVDMDVASREGKYALLAPHHTTVATALERTQGEAEAHLCQNFRCALPMKDVEELRRVLGG